MRFVRFPAVLLMALGVLSAPTPLRAQEVDSVVKKLQATHTITIGYRESSLPLSYLGPDNKPTGYAVEFCQRIAEAAKRDLKLPTLDINYVPVTIQTRQALIANGTVDIVCDGTVRTWARSKQVAFTPIHWTSAEQLLVLKSSGIKDLADLKGKIVIIATGGTSEPTVKHPPRRRAYGFPRDARQRPSGGAAGAGEPSRRCLSQRQRGLLCADQVVAASGEPGDRRNRS